MESLAMFLPVVVVAGVLSIFLVPYFRQRKVQRTGDVVVASVLNVESTIYTLNKKRVYRVFFGFTLPDGSPHQAQLKSTESGVTSLLPGQPVAIVAARDNPNRIYLADSLAIQRLRR